MNEKSTAPNVLFKLILLCTALAWGLTAGADENFPKPAELEPDVAFWQRVYTEVDTKSGFIHDAYNLKAVYQTLQLSGHRRSDEKTIKAAKLRYANILKRLASSRDGLSAEEAQVLTLWGPGVTNSALREAANNSLRGNGHSEIGRKNPTRTPSARSPRTT